MHPAIVFAAQMDFEVAVRSGGERQAELKLPVLVGDRYGQDLIADSGADRSIGDAAQRIGGMKDLTGEQMMPGGLARLRRGRFQAHINDPSAGAVGGMAWQAGSGAQSSGERLQTAKQIRQPQPTGRPAGERASPGKTAERKADGAGRRRIGRFGPPKLAENSQPGFGALAGRAVGIEMLLHAHG